MPEVRRPDWAETDPALPPDWHERVAQAIDVYMKQRESVTEMGWQTANAYTAIILTDLWASNKMHYDLIDDMIKRGERTRPDLCNEFNDDNLWWAICCVHAYSLSSDIWYLRKAEKIWRSMQRTHSVCSKGRSQCQGLDMEGGCFWTTRPGENQINSITTGLYAELSLRLALLQDGDQTGTTWKSHSLFGAILNHWHTHTDRGDYIEAARRSLGWILRTRYRHADGIVVDHFRIDTGEAVNWTFTYTTAVTMCVCALLYVATGEAEQLELACHLARKAISNRDRVEQNGVLTERDAYGKGTHDPAINNDAVGFKSIMIRHLVMLCAIVQRTSAGVVGKDVHDTVELIQTFLRINMDSQQKRNTDGKGHYGPWWNGPFEVPTCHSQMAVLDVMAAGMWMVNSQA